jgi:hypothetical protein
MKDLTNMNRTYLIILLLLIASRSKAQELLNANKKQIKTYMTAEGAILKSDRPDDGMIFPGAHNVLFFAFSQAALEKRDIGNIIFFLDKNDKCIRYTTKYVSDKFLKDLIAKYNNSKSGYKRKGQDLKWVDPIHENEVEILGTLRNGIKASSFTLDIHKKRM